MKTYFTWASQVAQVVKNPPANAGDIRDTGSIPGSERSYGGGHGNPLQYSCLENPMDRGAWRATVHMVAKNQTWLKQLSMHTRLVETYFSKLMCCCCLAELGLCCCAQAFSSFREWGLPFTVVCRLLIVAASFAAEHMCMGFSSCSRQA